MLLQAESQVKKCRHCSLEMDPRLYPETAEFCCNACQLVYEVIHENKLDNYYALRDSGEFSPTPAKIIESTFQHFDDPVFINANVRSTGDISEVKLYLSGIHCLACLWLIEKLPDLLSGVINARLDYSRSIVCIKYSSATLKLSDIAAKLNQLGYPPFELNPANLEARRKKEFKNLLYRLGVAGVCAGNTMLIAISLYQADFTGMQADILLYLRWVSLILAIPSVFYSARLFYASAWNSLKAGSFHIDLPISIGIIFGFFVSSLNVIRKSGDIYFDSLCMLIFLMLVGRVAQRRGLNKAQEESEAALAFNDNSATKIINGALVESYALSLQPGDLIMIGVNRRIPADSIVEQGESYVDNSVLTGESRPQPVRPGSDIFAGSINKGSEVRARVLASYHNSRYGKIVSMLSETSSQKNSLSQITDRISGYFVIVTIVTAVLNFIYWYNAEGFNSALSTTLALLVITCPCALGLSAPLAFSAALSQAVRSGILIKNIAALENLFKVRKIFLDKTGTLTYGKFRVVKESFLDNTDKLKILSTICKMEQNSSHPIANTVRLYCETLNISPDSNLTEVSQVKGHGIESKDAEGNRYRFGSVAFTCGDNLPLELINDLKDIENQEMTPVLFSKNNQFLAMLALGDEVRPGMIPLLQKFQNFPAKLYIISGDRSLTVKSISDKLGGVFQSSRGELLPEMKQKIIAEAKSEGELVMMIGDGANDSAALSSADIGVAVSGGLEECLQAADIYISKDVDKNLPELFNATAKVLAAIRFNIIFSIAYNIFGAIFAISGLANPLFAALLMPFSSITIVSSSLGRKYFSSNKNI